MKEDIFISIIVPIYNIKSYLHRCIDSLIGQSYRNMEIILVNDGSTDGCREICEQYAWMDNRIKVINKVNGGLVSARKAGTKEARGDYIVNVDGDDWIEPDRIRNLADKGISDHADMVYMSGLRKDYRDRSVLCRTSVPCKTYYGEAVIEELFPLFSDTRKCFRVSLRHNIWMWAVKREFMQRIQLSVDDRIMMAEDQVCIWRCLLQAGSVTVIEETGYHYTQQRESAITYLPSGKYNQGMRIWFEEMRNSVGQSQYNRKIKPIWISAAVITILLSNYGMFMQSGIDFLFPFTEVKKGSRIAVYGAGQIGMNIVQALCTAQDYEMVLWVDRNVRMSPFAECEIKLVEELADSSFDYVVLAVLDAGTAEEIRSDLMDMGIPKEKIATMNPEAVNEKILLKAWNMG